MRISQLLGVGGRDLSETVGGPSAMQPPCAMLDADPATDHIVLISKPPHPAADGPCIAAAVAGCDTP